MASLLIRKFALFLLLNGIIAVAQTLPESFSLPALTGSSEVGTVSFELVDHSRLDPFAPDYRPRDLMVSVFYPIQHTRRYSLAKDFTPLYATFLEQSLGLPAGLASKVFTRAYLNAYLHPTPNSRTQPEILLFSPGYSASRVDYSAKLSDLASFGYIAIGVDHPFDTAFLDYPDGRVLSTTPETLDPDKAAKHVDVRVQDLSFVLDILSTNATLAKKIPGVHGKLDVKKVGVFGHSIGGAAAASAILADKRFACGSNLDGSFWGDVVSKGVDRPFLLVSADGHNRTNDETWQAFWEHSTKSFKLQVGIEGTTHGTYSDQAVLYGYLEKLGLIPGLGGLFGSIDGERELIVESAYVSAFFEMCLKNGQGTLLKGPNDQFPEVKFFPN